MEFFEVYAGFLPLLFAVVGLFLLSLIAPKQKIDTPEAAKDIETPFVEEGSEVGVIFGTKVKKDAYVVWKGDLRIVAVRKKSGKK